ncbi:MAG: PepSY domain-containing protein [Paracoccus sp. (in: a-proteobacteria)]
MSHRRLPRLALAALLALGPLAALSQPLAPQGSPEDEDDIPADHDFARAAVARGEFLPLEAILDIVGKAHPGQVVEIELELDDGIWEYEIEIVTPGGRLIEVDLAATDGRILEVEDEDGD